MKWIEEIGYTWYPCQGWIGRKNGEEDLTIYPNPVDNYFMLKSLKYLGRPFEMKIYNIQGKMILNDDQYWMGDQVDIQDFATGIYFIHLIDGTDFLIAKFIKN